MPVVIGHSLGVLLAATPPRGMFRVLLRLTRRHPWLYTKAIVTGKSLCTIGAPALAREAFFSAEMPEERVTQYAARLQEESRRATYDTLFLDLPRPQHVTTPLLVLGPEHDAIFSPKEIRATARAYGTEAEIFPHMAHDMMLEAGWAAVAERIIDWLGTRGV